jgi:hypothetical protein
MSRKKPQTETPKEEAVQEEVVKHAVSDLVAASYEHFGVKPEVMVGALYSVEEASKEEAEALIKAFLSKGVN